MKKFLCILLSTLLLIALVSCGSSKEGEMLSSEDEFGVYENGQQVISALDLKAQYEDDGVFTFSRQGKEDFPGRTLETKRGIKIGSTLEDVCEAYVGIRVTVSDGAQALEINGEVAENISVDYFYQNIEKTNMGQNYYLGFSAYQIDGEFSEEKANQWIYGEIEANQHETFTMLIYITNGFVSDISLSA